MKRIHPYQRRFQMANGRDRYRRLLWWSMGSRGKTAEIIDSA
ncbi:MAG: hypothetical protein LBO77_04710 [Desulfovibrio sp.]|nr:hypothetical protein [Desulfovibrio sp.]